MPTNENSSNSQANSDLNDNLIPDKWDRYLGLGVTVVVFVLGAAIEIANSKAGGANPPANWVIAAEWLPRCLYLVSGLAALFKIGVFKVPGNTRSGGGK